METITISKLKEYQRFYGDTDTLARKRSYQPLNSAEDWFLISRLIGDLILVQKGLASNEYGERVRHELVMYCDSEESIEELKQMAIAYASKQTR